MNAWFFTALAAQFLAVSPVAAAAPARSQLHPETLVILTTNDVKGKTGPCGCHIPKGGLSRQASFADSVRAEYSNVLWLDNGGFFPEDSLHFDYSWFLVDAMKTLGVSAACAGDRELRFGISYLKAQANTGLPMLSANLYERKTNAPALMPYTILPVGNIKVGVFGLMNDKVDLGPSRDSIAAMEPQAVAKRIVPEMRKKGATVIVLLSQLGKIETEDLVTAVPGIDVAIAGRNVPLLQKGRRIKDTVVCYGGEQGQFFGRTEVTVDAKGVATRRENETCMLSPEVGERPEVQRMVKEFEDRFNEKLRAHNAAQSPQATAAAPEK